MNTCKATLRILSAHKLYLIIYLVLLGILMLSMSWSMLSSSASSANAGTSADPTYEPGRPTVAVVDRDANRGGVADGMRSYLSASSDLTDLPDDPETLQQAVASHWTDLIVIIPDGFAQGLLDAAADGTDASGKAVEPPSVQTVTSYTSGAGTMAGMTVNGFLTITRTALAGSIAQVDLPEQVLDGIRAGIESGSAGTGDSGTIGSGSNASGSDSSGSTVSGSVASLDDLKAALTGRSETKDSPRAPTLDDLSKAVTRAVDVSTDKNANRAIAVVDVPDPDESDAASAEQVAAGGFGNTMKTALYPLFLAMTICTSIILSAFSNGEVRRRLIASPQRMTTMALQRTATLCVFALLVCVLYLAATIALMAAAGLTVADVSPAGLAMTFGSTCVYALMTVACGFMLSECGFSEVAANGFANIFGLAFLFSSGLSVPLDIMPAAMVALAKLLPGWWYCVAIDNALGIGTASAAGASAAGWLGSLALVALFGGAFLCIGLAVGRIRRSRK